MGVPDELYNRFSSTAPSRPVQRRSTLLRVLHVTPYSADAWAYGGIPRVAGALTRGLARRGHDVTVCTTDAHGESTRLTPGHTLARSDGVTTRVFPNLSNTLAYRYQAFMPVGLSRFLRRNARTFDVAHLHACRNLPGAIAAHHLLRAGVPFVLAPNGTAPIIEGRRTAKRVFDAVVGRRILRSAARVVAVSDAETRQLEVLGVGRSSIRVVPNPLDLDEFDPPIPRGAFRRRHGMGNEPVVLFLGRITPRKRVDLLVSAFAQLDRPNLRLVIAGNDGGGPRWSAVRQDIALLTGRERLEALADADVVVYPSEHEIFGLVPLEALLCGTPVVVADDSGCGEIVGRVGGGKVFAAGRADALASAIAHIMDDRPRWRAAAREAAGRVRGMFGADEVCRRLEAVYEEVVP